MKQTNIAVSKLRPFENNPYQVRDDEEMNTLIESVQTQGILSPLIVRPIESTDEYEVISGHRRLHAAQKAGITEVPAFIYALDRDAAAIAVVDSNLHREHILPSEKAFAYKLKYHTVAESSLQKGAGHMPGTSLPIGGKSTHTVISAHSGMSGARMFTDLDKLQEGDLILLHVLGNTLAYAADTITVTDPADIEAIEIRQDEDLVTLVTCAPYGVNTHRLLVRGHRIELTEEELDEEIAVVEQETSTWMEKYIEGIFFGFIIGGAVIAAVLVLVRALSKKGRKNQ